MSNTTTDSVSDLIDLEIVNDLRRQSHHQGGCLYDHLLDIFFESATERVEQLKNPANDRQTVEYLAHALKGISQTLGARSMGYLCHDLERNAEIYSDEQVQEIVSAVEQLYAVTREELVRCKSC